METDSAEGGNRKGQMVVVVVSDINGGYMCENDLH